MIKNNKLKFALSSIIILLPIVFGLLLWNDLPARMTTHWGTGGVADGTMSKAAAVFILPCVLLVLHVVFLIISNFDKRYKEQSGKIIGLTFWVIPALSIVVNGMMYALALEIEFNVGLAVSLLLGLMFVVIGNYLPKAKRNCVYGIKLVWTLANDENWAKTHRLGGILWVACGLVVIPTALLPMEISLILILLVTAVAVLVPTVYSYMIYKRHKEEGIEYDFGEFGNQSKVAKRITTVTLPILVVAFVVLMFFGEVAVSCGDESFVVEATFTESLEVFYDEVDSIEIRDDFKVGARVYGFGSPKLLTGTFENSEYGRYTLYAYVKAETYVVLKNGDDVLVIGGAASDMEELYDAVCAKIGE